MSAFPDFAVQFFFAALALDLVAAAFFVAGGIGKRLRSGKSARARSVLLSVLEEEPVSSSEKRKNDRFIRRNRDAVLSECGRLSDSISLDPARKERLARALSGARIDVFLIRDLHSGNPERRRRAADRLSLVPVKNVRISLIHSLESEKNRTVKLAIIACLAEIGETLAIPSIIDSLAGEPLTYQRAVWGLLSDMGDELSVLVPILSTRPEKEIQLLLIDLATGRRSTTLLAHLLTLVDSRDLDISQAAFRVLSTEYVTDIDHERFIAHDDFLIRNLAVESLGRLLTTKSLLLLFEHMDDPVICKNAVSAITTFIRSFPQHFKTLLVRYGNEHRPNARAVLLDVFSNFVDYLAGKLLTSEEDVAADIILNMMRRGRLNDTINFLNRNSDPEIENKILGILKKLIEEKPACKRELVEYLCDRLKVRLGLEDYGEESAKKSTAEKPKLGLLYIFLAAGVLFLPALCAALTIAGHDGPVFDPRRWFFHFNAAFAVYSLLLNGSYVFLLFFSFMGVVRQAAIHAHMRESFAFKEHVLPSISIITPAFNEEASIVESVNALLTLHYPDYEIIVVNDGSTDATLAKLVSYFGLERAEVFMHGYLDTQPVRGVYANKRYPELLVMDKENGGKADSLNAGINVSRKEYFAGIDADSLIERDALLNLASLFLVSEEETVAMGGNIFPANGCTVSRGALTETRIPKNRLAAFQSIEYIRSFMAGRVGWAELRLLLIISGAFGVFHKRKVIDAHGYLTRSGHYMKDTVGEDMELVVRLARTLRETGIPHSIGYCYDANCWTEIPERFRVLSRQRDRWQRGLLEIMTFHSKMIGNPAFGRIGLVGFPYFLLFEVLGPWFEIEGYAVLACSLVFGLVGMNLFLVIFAASVLLGLFVSIVSMSIAEYRRSYFPLRDKLRLLLYAFLENFGFRQLMGILRIRGFVRMLARAGGWGKMERRGFTAARVKPERRRKKS